MNRDKAIRALAMMEKAGKALDTYDGARQAWDGMKIVSGARDVLIERGGSERFVFGLFTGIMGLILIPKLVKKGD